MPTDKPKDLNRNGKCQDTCDWKCRHVGMVTQCLVDVAWGCVQTSGGAMT